MDELSSLAIAAGRGDRGALAKFVEEAANGFAVIQLLQHKLPGLLAVKPLGGKVARARAVTPMIASVRVSVVLSIARIPRSVLWETSPA